jgi:hypothetical protein
MNQIMKDAFKGIFYGVIANFIYFIIQSLKVEQLRNISFGNANLYIYLGLPILGICLFVVMGRFQKKRRDAIKDKYSIFANQKKPVIPTHKVQLSKFGVNWKVQYGISIEGDEIAYIEGCYCPKCGCELDGKAVDRLFGWGEKYIWRCPNCGFIQLRPKDYLFHEKDALQKIAIQNLKTN